MEEVLKLLQKLGLALEAERCGALAEFRRELRTEGLDAQAEILDEALNYREGVKL